MNAQARDRTLICLRYGIGDVVMEMPALRGLRRLHPKGHFTVLGAWPALELLEDDPVCDASMGVQHFGFQHWGDRGTPEAQEQLKQWLRDSHFNQVIDACHTVLGIRQVLQHFAFPTFNASGGIEMDSRITSPGARSIWSSAVRNWGLPTDSRYTEPRLHIPAQATRRARAYFREHELNEHASIVALAPVASSQLKRWPLDRLCELIHHLTANRDVHLLLFGIDAGESSTIHQLQQAARPGSLHRIEPVHLQQTAALIARCHALLANDTGLMHIGAAMGTPTVAIFGPTSASVVLPLGATPASSNVACGYRLTDRFGPPKCVIEDHCLIAEESCISAVTVDQALNALTSVLDRPPPRGGHYYKEATHEHKTTRPKPPARPG